MYSVDLFNGGVYGPSGGGGQFVPEGQPRFEGVMNLGLSMNNQVITK